LEDIQDPNYSTKELPEPNKGIIKKPIGNIISNDEKINTFPQRLRGKQGCLLIIPIQHNNVSPI
jgi:hypothetical protein